MLKVNSFMGNQKKRIAIITSVPFTIKVFLVEQIKLLSQHYDVTLITSDVKFEGEESLESIFHHKVKLISIPIVRKISFYKDFLSFLRLYAIFRKEKFSVIHSVTPKAGLLAMASGFFSGVDHRLHVFTGQVWVTKKPPFRWLLILMDKLIGRFATCILVDSQSQLQFLIDKKIVNKNKSSVLANGSISGVDLSRFNKNSIIRTAMRKEMSISDSATVVLYLGRLNIEKGLKELLSAFELIARKNSDVILLLVGPDEDGILEFIKEQHKVISKNIRSVPYTDKPEHYMMLSDIFCLPSYREGFGSVVIEAAACGIPAVVTRIYGLTDAVIDKKTGIHVSVGNPQELSDALLSLINDKSLRDSYANAACERAIKEFDSKILSEALLNYYNTNLSL